MRAALSSRQRRFAWLYPPVLDTEMPRTYASALEVGCSQEQR